MARLGLRRPRGHAAELALVGFLLAAIVAAGFAPVLGSKTFAPNGRVPTQSGAPGVDFPYERQSRSVVNDGGAFAWIVEPTAKVVHEAYADGEAPLWNPYAGLGTPLAADLLSAPFGPLYAPVHAHPSQTVWDLLSLLRLLIGGLGLYALVRALGVRPAAAFAPAVGYMLASAWVLWVVSVSMSVEALVPWILLGIVQVVRTGSARWFAGLSLLVAAAVLGGQPEVLVALAYLCVAWGAYWWFREGRTLRALAELAGVAVVAGLVAAPQLLLAAGFVPDAVDQHAGGLGSARYTFARFGNVVLGDFAAQEEAAVAIGLLVLAAAGLAARAVPGGGLLLAVSAVWAVRALGQPGASVIGLLPGIDAINIRRYGLFILVVTVAVLAAGGIEAVLRGSRAALVAAFATVGLPLLAWALGAPSGNALPALAFAAAVALVLAGAAFVPLLAPALAAVLFVQFLFLTPRDYAEEYDPFEPVAFARFLEERLEPGERAAGLRSIMRPQVSSALRLPTPGTSNALYLERYETYMAQVLGTRPAERAGRAGWLERRHASSPYLAAIGVRYVVTGPSVDELGDGLEPVYRSPEPPGLVAWENENAFPRAWLVGSVEPVEDETAALDATREADLRTTAVVEEPTGEMLAAGGGGEATVEEIGWNRARFRVRADAPAVLVTSDVLATGWRATVDGEPAPIRPANVAMRAVAVPTGEHEVVFEYRPAGYRYGLWLTLLGLAALAARALVPAVRRR